MSITGPRKQEDDIATNYKVLRGSENIPVFPDGDLSSEHPEVVRKVLEGFILYLWGKLERHSSTVSNMSLSRSLSSYRESDPVGQYLQTSRAVL